jgi:hypothetical protein
MFHFLSY